MGVAEAVASLARDERSGAREIALRLIDALLAGTPSPREAAEAAARVAAAHPEMSLLDNISWLLSQAAARGYPPPPLLSRLRREIAGEAAAIAEKASPILEGASSVLTLSWSSTVYEALARAGSLHVYVMESLPGGEGRVTARRLASRGLRVTLIPASAAGHYAARVDAVVVGGDAVLRDGGLVNKAGTSLAACAAHSSGRPVYALVGLLKVDLRGVHRGVREFSEERGGYEWRHVVFDVTPPSHVTGYVTPRGVYGPGEVVEAARRYVEELLGGEG